MGIKLKKLLEALQYTSGIFAGAAFTFIILEVTSKIFGSGAAVITAILLLFFGILFGIYIKLIEEHKEKKNEG